MSNVFVSIVSDQAIPNILFLKEFSRHEVPQRYVFITTEEMERKKKTEYISAALGIKEDKMDIIKVSENSVSEIKKRIMEKMKLLPEDKYIVNITGGNKLMALAVYEYFLKKNAEIFYLEIKSGKVIRVQPEEPQVGYLLNKTLTPDEYIKGAGLTEIRHDEKAYRPQPDAETMKRWFLNSIREEDVNVLDFLRKNRNAKSLDLNPQLEAFLGKIRVYEGRRTPLTRDDIRYITGGWFEEYIYYRIKQELKLKDNGIWLNLKVKTPALNEFDVVFINKNILYIVECKTSAKAGDRNITAEVQYKSSALKRLFGLSVKSYFVTLGNLRDQKGNINKEHSDRSEAMGVTILDRKNVLDGKLIEV